MTETYAQAIERLRAEREEQSQIIIEAQKRRKLINVELLALEQAITPPKRSAAAKPGDIVMKVEPAEVKLEALPK